MTAVKNSFFAGIIVLSLTLACGKRSPSTQITPPTITPISPPVTPKITFVPIPEESFDILHWMMQDETACQGMIINVYHEMLLNDCHGNTINTQPEPLLFEEMVNRFAPFTYNSGKSEIIFQGKGDVSGEVWQRAMDRWAQTVYTEGMTGHVCSGCQTILAWNLGSTQGAPADCRRLVVLNFGYAYADKVPCVAGGQAIEHTADWLTTEEWEILDNWLTNRLFTTQAEGYFGSDGQAMGQEEIAQLKELANSIYSRITQNPSP